MSTALKRRNRPRRGVTLVEMLVVVALVVLMMVILVQIFQVALGAMSVSRTTQELDVTLRAVDSMIRSDLAGVTAKMTPPNIPSQKQGYFEYGENAAADLQGEDTDDYLAFTTKAPEGQVFTGRQWLYQFKKINGASVPAINQTIQPTTVTSQVAEVIYFLRNGNLYRRVFLVSPDRKASINSGIVNNVPNSNGIYQTSLFGTPLSVSWMGMNDISCRPGGIFNGTAQAPIPNDLGDLTNRENRAFRPRFFNDFTGTNSPGSPDGVPDDSNGDGVNDYYPTLYFDGLGNLSNGAPTALAPNRHIYELPYPNNPQFQRVELPPTAQSYDVYAFPFIYPGMYSIPDKNRIGNYLGWVHYLPPNPTSGYTNHSPLDLGETLNFAPGGNQTWWGFPTWRETMTGQSGPERSGGGWQDPILFVTNNSHRQPNGLRPFPPTILPLASNLASVNLLTPVTTYGTAATPYGYDGSGSTNFVANPTNPTTLWEDEMILSNVRSFDVKAYDPDAPLYSANVGTPLSVGYWDLGYAGLNPTTFAPNYNGNSTIWGPYGANSNVPALFQPAGQTPPSEPHGFGHEGRVPPAVEDYRFHPRRPTINVGDDQPGITRLTHTFDTWSTDYVNAPDSDIFLSNISPLSAPTYPSFNAPYPSPLRGIQIQVRIADPRNERTKVLTIRFDFSDKL